jgi:hypothetical protein
MPSALSYSINSLEIDGAPGLPIFQNRVDCQQRERHVSVLHARRQNITNAKTLERTS